MLLFMIGGYILIDMVEKETSRRVKAKRLEAMRRHWPELEVLPGRPRVYLTAEQRITGEGGDLFLFEEHTTEEALEIIHKERVEAEARAGSLLHQGGVAA